jgi:DNA helicase-2/ATP-dependent DNA helicase PcrA
MLKRLPAPARAEEQQGQEEVLEITFSDLASFRACGKAYRLRTLIGFQPSLVAELGYGKAVHHVLREVAEFARARKRKPNERELDRLFDDSFYLPAASKAGHREMKMYARDLVNRYLAKYEDDLHRIWAVERPFELHLPDAIVTGRADVIIDQSNGHERLAIVDYKTRDTEGEDGFQLQVYTDAGRREGLTVDRAFIHDLKKGDRDAVAVGEGDVEAARVLAGDLIDQLRNRKFVANPNAGRCGHCDVRPICKEGARG